MDSLTPYYHAIEEIFRMWERRPGPEADFRMDSIVDPEAGRYLLVEIGWDGYRRIYHTLVHIDTVDGKLWIQKDDTEHGIAEELVAAGVPRDRIVLGFKHESLRPYTEFAAA